MRLIELVVVVALSFVLAPLAAEGQPAAHPSGKVPTIGYLSWGDRPGPLHEAFRQGLRDFGYDEDRKNLVLHSRFADGSQERLAEFTAELVRLNVDVLVTSGGGTARAVQKVTSTIPVVFVGITDPIALGFVRSLARPGGNMTGFAYSGLELNPKRLEILKETLPHATRFAAVATSTHRLYPQIVEQLEAAAKSLRVQIKIVDVGEPSPPAIDTALEKISRDRPHGVLVLQHPEFNRERRRIVGLAAKYRIPTMYELQTYTDDGGLMSYATDVRHQFRRTGIYVDKILKGAKPADLPVELPTKFELVINLKTAKALELTIPPSVLGRADRVVE